MTNLQITITVGSSILSGLLGVIISTIYYRIYENRKVKFEILRKLVGYRFHLTASNIDSLNNDFFVALNEVVIVFHNNKEVIAAIMKMHEQLGMPNRLVDNLLTLIKLIAKVLNIKVSDINDSFLESPFIPNKKIN